MTQEEKLIKAIFGDWTPEKEMDKRTITAKEETVKALETLIFYHNVQYRVRYADYSKDTWTIWSTLTKERLNLAMNDLSVVDFQFSFNPDFD